MEGTGVQHFQHSGKRSVENNVQDLTAMCIILSGLNYGGGWQHIETDWRSVLTSSLELRRQWYIFLCGLLHILLVSPRDSGWQDLSRRWWEERRRKWREWEGAEVVSGKGVIFRETMYIASFPGFSILWGWGTKMDKTISYLSSNLPSPFLLQNCSVTSGPNWRPTPLLLGDRPGYKGLNCIIRVTK